MNIPNRLTIARIIAVPFFVAAYLLNFNIIAFIIFILASVTDTLDGNIARKYNMVSNFGKIMDPLADKVLVYSAFCLMIPEYVAGWMLILILTREFLVSGIRTVAASKGQVIAAGMSGKIKTTLQMIAVPALILSRAFPGFKPLYWFAVIMLWASLAMTVYSGAEYTVKNKQVFK